MLTGKLALVTGGSRGIGEAIVEKLARSGATVVFTYHSNKDRARLIVERLASEGLETHCLSLDITNKDHISHVLEEIYNQYGVPDILVNNAGITRDKLFVQMREEDWFQVMNTNLNSLFQITKSISYKMLLNEKNGSIINMSSVSGIVGTMGQTNYSAAKAGINGFTRSLAKELGKYNIRVNAVAPGYVDTDMVEEIHAKQKKEMNNRIPLKRMGSRDEIADVVLFLSSSMSNYVTGTILVADGGLTC